MGGCVPGQHLRCLKRTVVTDPQPPPPPWRQALPRTTCTHAVRQTTADVPDIHYAAPAPRSSKNGHSCPFHLPHPSGEGHQRRTGEGGSRGEAGQGRAQGILGVGVLLMPQNRVTIGRTAGDAVKGYNRVMFQIHCMVCCYREVGKGLADWVTMGEDGVGHGSHTPASPCTHRPMQVSQCSLYAAEKINGRGGKEFQTRRGKAAEQ